jgi:hypothetical protein
MPLPYLSSRRRRKKSYSFSFQPFCATTTLQNSTPISAGNLTLRIVCETPRLPFPMAQRNYNCPFMLPVTGFNVNAVCSCEMVMKESCSLFLRSKVKFSRHINSFCAYRSLALLRLVVVAIFWIVWSCSIVGFALDKPVVQPNKREWHRHTHLYNLNRYQRPKETSTWAKYPLWENQYGVLQTKNHILLIYIYQITCTASYPTSQFLYIHCHENPNSHIPAAVEIRNYVSGLKGCWQRAE